MPKVFFSMLKERQVNEYADEAIQGICYRAGKLGFVRISVAYARVDVARNELEKVFKENSNDPNDALVMLDCDMVHPQDVLERLTRFEPAKFGVVGALYFCRQEPHPPAVFYKTPENEWTQPIDDLTKLSSPLACDFVGTGAMMIRRWVFDALEQNGFVIPHFRFGYTEGELHYRGEDTYFAKICAAAGIQQYVDTSTLSLHLLNYFLGGEKWFEFVKEKFTDTATDAPVNRDWVVVKAIEVE